LLAQRTQSTDYFSEVASFSERCANNFRLFAEDLHLTFCQHYIERLVAIYFAVSLMHLGTPNNTRSFPEVHAKSLPSPNALNAAARPVEQTFVATKSKVKHSTQKVMENFKKKKKLQCARGKRLLPSHFKLE